MKAPIIICMAIALSILVHLQEVHAFESGHILSCSSGLASFEIDRKGSGELNLHLTRDGGGIREFPIYQEGSEFHSAASSHETIYQVDVTRKANGDYFLVLADGFLGAYEFAPNQCE